MFCSLVPEDLILQLIRVDVIADHQALEVLCALVHEGTEHLERRKHARIILVDPTTITENVLAENEHEVHVGAQIRRNT